MKVLIGYDGSIYADAALNLLQSAGLPQRTDIVVVSVAGRSLSNPPPSSYELVEAMSEEKPGDGGAIGEAPPLAEAEALALALQGSNRIKSIFPDWDVRAVAESSLDSPARILMQRADEWGADLIVVGSQGRSMLGRMILGSVSRKIATDATCSVLVGRSSDESLDAKKGLAARIIIGLDGSESSGHVVRAVAARAWPDGSGAKLVTALIIAPGLDVKQQTDRAKELHQSAEALLRSAGLDVSSIIKVGEPKDLLLEEAETWQADCIFVGARGLSGFGRFLLGSVSTAVVTDAKCSVEIVRVRQMSETVENL